MRSWLIVGATLIVACSSKSQSVSTVAAPSAAAPSAVAAAFLQAVADSNLNQMGALWGNAKGAAAVTGQPANWLQRMAVVHAYLRGGTTKVMGDVPGSAKNDQRQLAIELSRSGCVKTVPFTMIQTKQGAWLVYSIDLNAAGVPGRPCQGSTGTLFMGSGFIR